MAFVENVETIIQCVNETIDNMPVGLWVLFLEKMLHPFIKRLVKVDSKRILPPKWMEALPAYRPPTSLRQNYYDLCAVLLSDKTTYGTRCRELIEHMQKPAYELIHGLFNRDHDKEEFRNAFMGISTQLQMINGQYTVYLFVKNHLRDYATVDFLVSYIVKCGSAEFILQALWGYIAEVHPPDHGDTGTGSEQIYKPRMESLEALIIGLQNHLHVQEERRTAMAMALHSRLGSMAGLGLLGNDLLNAMAPVDTAKIVLWHELITEFVGFV